MQITRKISQNTKTTGKSYHDRTYWCWNISFSVIFRFADIFLTRFIVITKQRAAIVGHLDRSHPAKGRSAVSAEVVCAQGVHPTCSFKMADEDDEKFLYGGREKLNILQFLNEFSTVSFFYPDGFLCFDWITTKIDEGIPLKSSVLAHNLNSLTDACRKLIS